MRFEKILILVNPHAGLGRGRKLSHELAQRLESSAQCTVRETTQESDACRWAASASDDGYDLVVAIGGDGTFLGAVSGLIQGRQSAAVAHVPAGTANAVAVALDLPRHPREAAEMILSGSIERIDVGYLPEQERYFTVMAVAGFAARMLEDSTQRLKNRFGMFAYWVPLLRYFIRRDHARIELEMGNERIQLDAHTILIANIGRFEQLGLTVSPQTSPFDGQFDVAVATDRTPWQTLVSVLRILTRRHRKAPALRLFRTKRIRVTAVPSIPVQVDGELAGSTPILAEVLPGAVAMLLPPS
jgi:diacylglycerol kinase (ATP)